MLDRRDPDWWRECRERKELRDEEYRTGKIGGPTYIVSLMQLGFTNRAAKEELALLERPKR